MTVRIYAATLLGQSLAGAGGDAAVPTRSAARNPRHARGQPCSEIYCPDRHRRRISGEPLLLTRRLPRRFRASAGRSTGRHGRCHGWLAAALRSPQHRLARVGLASSLLVGLFPAAGRLAAGRPRRCRHAPLHARGGLCFQNF